MSFMCDEHQMEKEGLCEWCSRVICEECISYAHGKKYCQACADRLNFHELGTTNRSIASRSRENVDPTLTRETMEEGKKFVEQTVSANKEHFKGIRNAPDGEDIQELRKKREEHEKMRQRFNI